MTPSFESSASALMEAARLSRRNVEGGRSLDEVIRFCVAHPAETADESILRRLMTSMVRSTEAIFDMRDETGQSVTVALVLDMFQSPKSCGRLEFVGTRGDVAAEDLEALLFLPAIAFARTGHQTYLDVGTYPWLTGARATLSKLGMKPAYSSYRMTLSADVVPKVVPPPSGFEWHPLTPITVTATHALLEAAFAQEPATYIMPLEEFQQAALKAPQAYRLLFDGSRLVGVTITSTTGRHGEVRNVARHPRDRGRGLGEVLLGDALDRLRRSGADELTIEVDTANARALGLYERAGFKVVSELPTYRIALL